MRHTILVLIVLFIHLCLALPSCNKAAKLYKQGKLYDVLGVKKSANSKEIRKAFKKMSVQCHPDKDKENPEADNNFIAITGAYETLSDETERKNYDMYGSGSSSSGPSSSSGGGSRGGSSSHAHRQQWRPKDFQDINVDNVFASFFQGGGGGGGQRGSGFRFGGDADDDSFQNMFKSFTFNSRSKDGRKTRTTFSSGPPRQRQQTARASRGAPFDSMFGSFNSMFGSKPNANARPMRATPKKQQQQRTAQRTQQTRSSKAPPRTRRPKQNNKGGCRFSVKHGEICD